MAKTEDIEAKLAGYVDGDLDAAGRAQIEEYLANNPQHRQLIDELMKQRNMLRGLPRASAPADIAESFNTQLERAVLLGDVDGTAALSTRRIGFWPQLRAMAAILVVTLGLAWLIYYLLPSPQHASTTIADLRTTAPAPATASPEEPNSDATKFDASPMVGGANLEKPLVAVAADRTIASSQPISEQEQRARLALSDRDIRTGEASIPMPEIAGGAPASPLASNSMTPSQQMFGQVVAELSKAAPEQSHKDSSLLYVMPTANPQGTNEEVTRYLDDKHITWETTSEPMPVPLALSQDQATGAASRLMQQRVQAKTLDASQARPAVNEPAAQVLQRIVARQVSRQQAAQVMADLDQLQQRRRNESKSDPTMFLLSPTTFPTESLPMVNTPTTLSTLSRFLPTDVFAMTGFGAASAKTEIPSTQSSESSPFASQARNFKLNPAELAGQDDRVDLTIVLQPRAVPATTEPSTTAPAP
ncbi:MAG TPA: hypothetical protein VHD56_07390 [Tepidisphaeraceae bacterium]|nr:hypothetical protein [Tepidisphaeraceae bacterium]